MGKNDQCNNHPKNPNDPKPAAGRGTAKYRDRVTVGVVIDEVKISLRSARDSHHEYVVAALERARSKWTAGDFAAPELVTATIDDVKVTLRAHPGACAEYVQAAADRALSKWRAGDFEASAEHVVMDRVRDGRLHVRPDGTIWRRSRGDLVSAEQLSGCGYIYTRVSYNGTRVAAPSHRIAYRVLVGPIPPGHEINHLDGDRTNNWPLNLEAVTHSENLQHAVDVLGKNRGEQSGTSKLTEDDVRTIRSRRREGDGTCAVLAQEFGVTRQTVAKICRGASWRHVA